MTPVISGYFILEVVIAGVMNVPFLGEIRVVMRSVLSADIRHTTEGVHLTQKVCWVESYDDTRVSNTIIPASFVESIPVQRIPIRFDNESIFWDPEPVFIGYKEGGPLPSTQLDLRVIDGDDDGEVGNTVLLDIPIIGIVELYLVQVNDLAMSGKWTGKEYHGELNIQRLEQETLGASHSVFQHSNQLIPDENESYFRLSPTPNQRCSDIEKDLQPLNPEWRR
jgi:hypothetical protein